MQNEKDIIKVLIVDDEPEACSNLEALLTEYGGGGIEICGMAHTTRQAEAKIQSVHPDAVFMDIEMPNENAFSFLHRISPFNFEVIFVTAFDEYAIKAFKLNAIDYLLKPISIKELAVAAQKLRERIQLKKILWHDASHPFSEISSQLAGKTKQHKITLKDNNNVEVIDFSDIYFVEANGSYSKIVFLKNGAIKEVTMCCLIAEYEELLPPEMFYRIHRSYLINCGHVKNILKDDSNQVVLDNGVTLPVSRRRFGQLLEFLQKQPE